LIIELLILRLAVDGVMAKYDQDMQRQRAERKLRQLKMQLASMLNQYQTGAITADQYMKIESDILTAIEAMK
jgi:hypothetical protein